MKFPLHQLYGLNKSKPMVEVEGVEGELQWDYCDLDEDYVDFMKSRIGKEEVWEKFI